MKQGQLAISTMGKAHRHVGRYEVVRAQLDAQGSIRTNQFVHSREMRVLAILTDLPSPTHVPSTGWVSLRQFVPHEPEDSGLKRSTGLVAAFGRTLDSKDLEHCRSDCHRLRAIAIRGVRLVSSEAQQLQYEWQWHGDPFRLPRRWRSSVGLG